MVSSILAETIDIIKEKAPAPLQEIRVDDVIPAFAGMTSGGGYSFCW
jgi:hypothetical protein